MHEGPPALACPRRRVYTGHVIHARHAREKRDLRASHMAGDEVHLYVVPATNLSLGTVDRAKRPQQLGHGTHSGSERAREHQATRPQIRPHATMIPCAGHRATLRVDIGPAEDLPSTHWTTHAEHQEQATEQRVLRRQQQCSTSVRVQQYGCGD
jgi:hypothetical protein